MAEPKATFCPNCLQQAMRTGNEITCETCDTTFVITKKQEAKVKEFGSIRDHENRIRKLEAEHPEKQEPAKPGTEPKQKDVPEEDEDL